MTCQLILYSRTVYKDYRWIAVPDFFDYEIQKELQEQFSFNHSRINSQSNSSSLLIKQYAKCWMIIRFTRTNRFDMASRAIFAMEGLACNSEDTPELFSFLMDVNKSGLDFLSTTKYIKPKEFEEFDRRKVLVQFPSNKKSETQKPPSKTKKIQIEGNKTLDNPTINIKKEVIDSSDKVLPLSNISKRQDGLLDNKGLQETNEKDVSQSIPFTKHSNEQEKLKKNSDIEEKEVNQHKVIPSEEALLQNLKKPKNTIPEVNNYQKKVQNKLEDHSNNAVKKRQWKVRIKVRERRSFFELLLSFFKDLPKKHFLEATDSITKGLIITIEIKGNFANSEIYLTQNNQYHCTDNALKYFIEPYLLIKNQLIQKGYIEDSVDPEEWEKILIKKFKKKMSQNSMGH